jgi:hypothetical protein
MVRAVPASVTEEPQVTNRSAAIFSSTQSVIASLLDLRNPAVCTSSAPVAAMAAMTRPVRPGDRTRLSAASRPSSPRK